jgi:hypothetical protein
MLVRPKPVALQGSWFMSHKPEGAKARRSIALLPLPVSFLALELNLRLEADAPGAPRSTAQDISPPVLTLRCLTRLLGQTLPPSGSRPHQALSFEVEVDIAFLGSFGSVTRRMSEEPGSQA